MQAEGESGRRHGCVVALQVAAVVLACLAAGGAIYVRHLMKARATPPPPLPMPNGYDDLVRAAGMIPGIEPNKGSIRGAKVEELRDWVAANREALRVAREGLGRPSRVPVVYSQDLSGTMDHISGLRKLGRLFAAEAEVARQEGRPGDAARSSLDELRLGRAAGRGGLMIDVLAGIAIESQALDQLGRVRDDLPIEEARRVAAAMAEAEADQPSFAEVRNDEEYWHERTMPYWPRLMLRASGVGERLREPADKAAIQAIERTKATIRREREALVGRLPGAGPVRPGGGEPGP